MTTPITNVQANNGYTGQHTQLHQERSKANTSQTNDSFRELLHDLMLEQREQM